jgi:hypothetical protein
MGYNRSGTKARLKLRRRKKLENRLLAAGKPVGQPKRTKRSKKEKALAAAK